VSGYGEWPTECLFSTGLAGTTTTPTAGAVNLVAGWPPIVIPGNYFTRTGANTRCLRFAFNFLLTATATVPTFAFSLYTTSVTPPAFAATNLMCTATSTVTPTAGSNYECWMEGDMFLRTLALGAGSTIVTSGRVRCPSGFPSPFELTLPPTGTGNTFATWDSQQQYFLWPALTLGAATAGNTATAQWGKVWGEN